MEPLMTSDEVATFLKVDVVTIRRLVSRGELPAYRVGGEYRFTQDDLREYLQRQRVSGGGYDRGGSLREFPQREREMVSRNRLDKFTERGRKVLMLAQQEAQQLRHSFVGTEHLLLALIRVSEGTAVRVLVSMDVDLVQLRNKVEVLVGSGERASLGEVGLTRRAKMAIELAVDEMKYLGHGLVGTEHLLLGLIREGEGVAGRALESMGVNLEKARKQTVKVLNGLRTEVENPPPVPLQAGSLLAEGEQALTCSNCGASCPVYFHNCFNCGARLMP